MCLVGGIRTRHKKQRKCWRFSDGLDLDWAIHADTKYAQNTYLIYSMCRLLLNIYCSNVLNTLFINKAVVNLAMRALVTYITVNYLYYLLTNTWEPFKATYQYLRIFQSNLPILENLSKQLTNTWESFKATYQHLRIFQSRLPILENLSNHREVFA